MASSTMRPNIGSLRMDQLPIDKEILRLNITRDDLDKPIFKKYRLIQIALLCGEMKIVKHILSIDPLSYRHVQQSILCDMVNNFKHADVLSFLSMLDDKGQKFMLYPDQDWFLLVFFSMSIDEYIKQIIKYKIDYDIIHDEMNILTVYMKSLIIEKNIDKELFKKILILSKPLIINHLSEISPIVHNMSPFNKDVLDTFLEVYPDGLTMFQYRFLNPLIISINSHYNEFFDYIIEYFRKTGKKGYNYFGITSPIITAVLKENNYYIETLLTFPDLDVNSHDKFRNLPSHIMLKSEKISIENKRKILEKTLDVNIQNIHGSTVLFIICSHKMLSEFSDILEMKLCDIFVKNNMGESPVEICNDIPTLSHIVVKGFINNSDKTHFNGVCMPKLSATSKIKYKNILDCITKQIDDVLHNNQQIKLHTNIKFIKEKDVDNSSFQSNTLEAYIYLLYYVQKFNVKLLSHTTMSVKKGPDSKQQLEILKAYPKLCGVDIFWYDNNDNIMIDKFDKVLLKLKSGIYFIYLTLISVKRTFHQNGIIIDVDRKRILRFEPHGAISNNSQELFDKMFSILCKKAKYEYLPASKFMEVNSFQTLADEGNYAFVKIGDPGGYCLAWTLWFLEFYMVNSDQDPKLALIHATNQIINSGQTFKEYIRAYANKLTNYKVKFLRTIKYPAKKIFNLYQSETDKDLIFDKLCKKLL